MAFTTAQLEQTVSISSTASLISGAAVITDNSNYASLGITTGDVVKVLLQILDPTTEVFYQNAGYLAADFSSPDLLPITTPTTYSFTLPTSVTGDYIQGEYTVNMKVQVTQGSEITEAFAARYMDVCSCCNGVVSDVRGEVSYNTAVVSATDYTDYKTWTSLTNTLSLYAPVGLAAVQTGTFHGSPATLVFEPPVGTFPYTGTWQWKLVSDITFTDSETQTSTTCRITGQGSFEVVQSELCKVRCLLDKYRTDFYAKIAVKNDPQFERNWNLASDDYLMAFASERCGLPQTTIQKYITNIYRITGIDPDCDCGCDEGVSQPLVPTSIINGTDGTDGTIIYNGTGVPLGSLGVIADYYIRTTNGALYQKTGATTWSFLCSLIGATGATGADGSNGVAVLHNDISDSSTAGTSLEILKTYTLPAATLATDGSYLEVRARFRTNTDNNIFTSGKLVGVYFNGNALPVNPLAVLIPNVQYYDIVCYINRFSNTVLKNKAITNTMYSGSFTNTNNGYNSGFSSMAGLNLTTTGYDITAKANSDVIADLTCESLTVTLYLK